MRPAVQILLLLPFILMALFSCSELPPEPVADNVFDPENPVTGGDPLGLSAELQGTTVELSWNQVYIDILNGYKIYRTEVPDDIYDVQLAETDYISYSDSTIENGHKYYYLVTAYNYLGESRSSALIPFEIDARPLFLLNDDSPATMSLTVTANILATGADSMRISIDGEFDDELWEEYLTSRLVTFSNVPEAKHAFLEVLYPDGDTSEVVSDSILPQELTPDILLGNGSGYTDSAEFVIYIGNAGALTAIVWEGNNQNTMIFSPVPESVLYTVSYGDGEKVISVSLQNDYYTKLEADTITLDTEAEILSVVHDGGGRVLVYGDTLRIETQTAINDEGGTAKAIISDQFGNLRYGIFLEDIGGGYYAADYVIGSGDNIIDGTVTGEFTDIAGNHADPVDAPGLVNIEFSQAGMVFVPAGEFEMGNSHVIQEPDETPVHTVYVSDFWICETEVSNAEYAEFLCEGNNAYYDNRMEIICITPNSEYEAIDTLANKPVRFVTWDAAETYSAWRGMRLPTEAEWEKAARGPDSDRFPWGDTPPPFSSICNFNSSDDPYEGSPYPTTPVGFFNGDIYGSFTTYSNASNYGAFDMAGNVSEWCSDYYSANYYQVSPNTDPENTTYSTEKVVRSGNWGTVWIDVYCANRYACPPGTAAVDIGFRVVQDP